MKTILKIFDFDITTGDVMTNKGYFTRNQFDVLLTKIDSLRNNYRTQFDVKEIKNGWLFREFNPVKFMNCYE